MKGRFRMSFFRSTVKLFLLLFYIFFQANDTNQSVQKFLCLVDGSKIELDENEQKQYALIKTFFDDNPDVSEFQFNITSVAYQALHNFVHSDGKIIPDETRALNQLFHYAGQLEIRKNLLGILSDKIVECNNFRSLPYDDQRILASDCLSRLKYTPLINTDLNGMEFPYIDVSIRNSQLQLISKFAHCLQNNDGWFFGPTQTFFCLYDVPTLFRLGSATISERNLTNALVCKFALKSLVQKNSRGFLPNTVKVFKALKMILVFEHDWLHILANGTVRDIQAEYFKKIVKVCGDKKQSRLYFLFHQYNNEINSRQERLNSRQEKFGTYAIEEWQLDNDQNNIIVQKH